MEDQNKIANHKNLAVYFLELAKAEQLESKLRLFFFKIKFHFQVSDLRQSFNIVNSVSEEVRNSTKLNEFLKKVLYIGNIFDSDRRNPVFGLAGLSRLKETRSPNSKITAMHYLCKSCADKNPEILDFPKDLISLEAASKIELKYLAEEIEGISDCLEKAKQELAAADNDDPFFQNFQKAALKEFVIAAEAELSSVKDLNNVAVKNGDKLAQYFDAKSSLEKVVAALVDFVETFKRACEDNIAIAEEARQRAVDEAAMEIIEAYKGVRYHKQISLQKQKYQKLNEV